MTMLAALIGLALTQAVAAPATPQPDAPRVVLPVVPGVTDDPTCGGRPALAAIAACFATTQGGVEAALDAVNTDFVAQGWIAAGGTDNRIVYVKRKPQGGCEAFQIMAFAPNASTADPAAPAYLALATVPGDICSATTPTPSAP